MIESTFVLFFLTSFFSLFLSLSYFTIANFWIRYQTQEFLFCSHLKQRSICVEEVTNKILNILPIGQLTEIQLIDLQENNYHSNISFKISEYLTVREAQILTVNQELFQ